MSELGAIADTLEERGHPGPAAAVRTLEYVLSLEHTAGLDSVLDHAVVRLRDDPEMKRVLLLCVAELRDRRHLRSPSHAGIQMNPAWQGQRAIPVSDPHRVLEFHPRIREGIDRWIADPAPKLPGIDIAVMPRSRYGTGMDVEIRVERTADGRRWAGIATIEEFEIAHGRVDLAEMAYYQMEELHRRMIESLRDEQAAR